MALLILVNKANENKELSGQALLIFVLFNN